MKSKMASKGGAKGGRMPTGMKLGGSAGNKFPDLSGDGKVTQKDILIGKGVVKKKNGGMMKSKGGAIKKPGGMQAGGMAGNNKFISVDEFERQTPRGLPKRKKSVIPATTSEKRPSTRGTAVMRSKGGTIKKPGGMKNGGMAKKGPKGYAKGGATTKNKAVSRKPRGVGVALRGYGKAMKK